MTCQMEITLDNIPVARLVIFVSILIITKLAGLSGKEILGLSLLIGDYIVT